jgi:hypothetical protein
MMTVARGDMDIVIVIKNIALEGDYDHAESNLPALSADRASRFDRRNAQFRAARSTTALLFQRWR